MSHSIEFEVWRERRREMLREADERRLVREVRGGRSSVVASVVLRVEKLIRWPGEEARVRSAMSVTPKETGGSLKQHGEY